MSRFNLCKWCTGVRGLETSWLGGCLHLDLSINGQEIMVTDSSDIHEVELILNVGPWCKRLGRRPNILYHFDNIIWQWPSLAYF